MKEWLNSSPVIASRTLPVVWRDVIFRFGVPVLGVLLGSLIISIILRRLIKRFTEEGPRRDGILRWERRIIRVLTTLGIILSLFSLLGEGTWSAFADILRILNTPFFTSGNTQISVVTIFLVIVIIVVANWVGRLVNRALQAGTLHRFGLDAEQAFSIGRLIRYAVMVVVFLFGLTMVGIDLSAIGVLFGVLGIGIGFGLQNLVADFFAGILLISMGLVKEGDRIRVADTHDGFIRRIRLMNTELVTFENETLIIPNSQLSGNAIHNFSYKDRRIVIVNEVDVSYGSDLDKVIDVMLKVAGGNPWASKGKDAVVRVRAFAASGITMQLRTWVKDVGDGLDAFSWTNLEIWRAFAAEGIEIPFPQRVIHQAPSPSDDNIREPVSESSESSDRRPD